MKRSSNALVATIAITLLAIGAVVAPARAEAASTKEMFRLYNPNSGEHFYTASAEERDATTAAGWMYEGVGWVAPTSSSVPVYRVYNPYAGDHHYTTDVHERDTLVSLGWRDERVGWYSAGSYDVLRQYNPNAVAGAHNFTTNADESNALVQSGWTYEGVAWRAMGPGESASMIMGASRADAGKLERAYDRAVGAGRYPGQLANGGCPSLSQFCQIVAQEAAAEGVRAEVAFAQEMYETGWLYRGGSTALEGYNFCGLISSSGSGYARYGNVREGVRAHIQYLKAYASTAGWAHPLVDGRAATIQRGCAPTVEQLAGRWAESPTYAVYLKKMINQVLSA